MKTHLQVVPMLAVVGFLPTGLVSAEDSALPTAKPKAVPVVSIGMDSPALDYNFSSSGLPNVNLGKMATKPVPPKPVKPVPKEFMEVPTPVESKPEKPKSVYVAPTFLPVAKPAVAPSKTMAPLAPKPETMNATTFPTLKAIPMEKQLESLDQTQLQAELPKMNTTVELKPIPKTEIKPLKPVTASTTKVVPKKGGREKTNNNREIIYFDFFNFGPLPSSRLSD